MQRRDQRLKLPLALGVPPGYWSDDGAQALCLLASLLHHDGLDLEDLGRRFRNGYNQGYLAAGGKVFDIGIQTSRALGRLAEGVPVAEAGPSGEWDNGNGSLMRVLPLALWHQGTDQDLFDDACRQSLVTHGHPRSQVCYGLYCLWARAELRQEPDAWRRAVEQTVDPVRDRPDWKRELDENIEPHRAPGGSRRVAIDGLGDCAWIRDGAGQDSCIPDPPNRDTRRISVVGSAAMRCRMDRPKSD